MAGAWRTQEFQYLSLLKNIINNGVREKGRNGITYTQIGGMMRFSLKNNQIPIMTTKKMAWRVCLKELLWFMNGDTNNELLQKENVKIWNDNANREFLDSRGLYHLRENDLGPVYGHQWRFWNAPYSREYGCFEDYRGKGIDQLQNIIDDLNESKITGETSRRMIMTAWNPEQIDEMALPPCHVLSQFHITEGNQLSCTLYQRSADMGLGVPFNIASYAFLTHILAKHCDLEAKEFIHFIGNAHIYDDHIDSLEEQICNEPYDPPNLIINEKKEKIEDYKFEDFIIENYNYHKPIKMKMRA
jgi:thymidylate synthase|tara:strand:- start:287 stop:1189 length:903 start_codon:yes stop_codon:yes gene_type:complete